MTETTIAREPLKLECRACGHMTVLDATEQAKILASFRLPSQRHIVNCPCGAYQFALSAGPIRQAVADGGAK